MNRPLRTVAVTGASGFIGSHLVGALLKNGFEVIAADVTSAGPCDLVFLQMDITRDDLDPLFRDADAVVHLAGIPGARGSWGASFTDYSRVNVLGTQRVLEACVRNSVRRVVFASSSSVYGQPSLFPIPESTVLMPLNPYGVTKATGEDLCRIYATNWPGKLEIIMLRYFTVYGPRQRPDMLISRLLRASLLRTPINLYGGGEQRRDFTFVHDAVSATVAALSCDLVSRAEPINVGSGKSISLIELITEVEKVCGTTIPTHPVPMRDDEAQHTMADLGRARRMLFYEPKVSLADGLGQQLAEMAEVIEASQ